jgi:hypothetical protein
VLPERVVLQRITTLSIKAEEASNQEGKVEHKKLSKTFSVLTLDALDRQQNFLLFALLLVAQFNV